MWLFLNPLFCFSLLLWQLHFRTALISAWGVRLTVPVQLYSYSLSSNLTCVVNTILEDPIQSHRRHFRKYIWGWREVIVPLLHVFCLSPLPPVRCIHNQPQNSKSRNFFLRKTIRIIHHEPLNNHSEWIESLRLW